MELTPHVQQVLPAPEGEVPLASPALFYFCPDAEISMARGLDTRNYHRRRQEEFLAQDLEILCAFLCSPDDVLLARRIPSDAHRRLLLDAGFHLPAWEPLAEDGSLAPQSALRQRTLAQLCPWAWCEPAATLLHPLRANLAPPAQRSTPVWSEALRALFSKETSVQLARLLLQQIPCPGTEPAVIGHPVTSLDELHRSVTSFQRRGFAEVLVKAPFAASGQGNLRWESGRILPWCRRRLSQGGTLVVEPLLQRLFDFSVHYQRSARGTRFLGFVRLQNNAGGQFQAVQAGPGFCHGLPPLWSQLFQEHACPLFQDQFPPFLDQILAPAGYTGPVGIDAFLYQNPSGGLKLKPLVELNPRFTMGRVIWEIQRRAAPSRVARLELHRSLPPAAGRFQLHPHSGKLVEADLILNEPVSPLPCYARLLVGESHSRFQPQEQEAG